MDQQQIQDNEVVSKRGRLSTEMINLGSFSAEKVSGDLEALEIAEKENNTQDITIDEDENISQEMLALGLSNPFRGY